jgi:ParB family chromosome partitioning protein
MEIEKVDEVNIVPIDRITTDPNQPRKYFNEEKVMLMAGSIAEKGLIQPILIRPIENPDYDYMIVHGEMRFRGTKSLGNKTIKAIVRNFNEKEVRDLQLLENIHRSDLSDIELAWEFQSRVELGETHEQIAKLVGKDRSYVTQRLSLLKLPISIQHRILKNEITFSQARVLLSVKDKEIMEKISNKISNETTIRETQEIVKELSPDVTHVTLPYEVKVKELHIISILCDGRNSFRDTVPQDKLLWAYIEDLKQLRRRQSES